MERNGLPYPNGNDITSVQKTFCHQTVQWTYSVFDVSTRPDMALGETGDIAVHKSNAQTWVRFEDRWEQASREVGPNGRPVQKHPILRGGRRLCSDNTWKSQSHWSVAGVQRGLKKDETESYGKRETGPQDDAIERPMKRLKESEVTHVDVGVQTTAQVTASNNIPLAADFHNKWIEDLYTTWNSLPIVRIEPLCRVGSQILATLLSLPFAIPLCASARRSGIQLLGAPNRSATRPTLSLVIEDINAGGEFNAVDFITRFPEEAVGPVAFFTSMCSVFSSAPWKPGARVYGLLDVPATRHGIQACQLTTHPFDADPSCITEKGWTTTWTLPGGISHPHMDFYGPIQYMVHFHGRKLWILWPPTHKNLEWYSDHHKQVAPEHLTIQAIQNLEGLQIHYFDGSSEEAFIVNSNYIHAVLSISESAHCGTRVWRLEDFQEAQRLMQWGLTWCANSSDRGTTKQETLIVLELICEDLRWWMSLADRQRGHTGRKMKKDLGSLQSEVEAIRRQIGIVESLTSTSDQI